MADQEARQNTVRQQVLHRLLSRVTYALEHPPLDIEYLQFICCQEMTLITAMSANIGISQDLVRGLMDLDSLIQQHKEGQQVATLVEMERSQGCGRPRIHLSRERLIHFLKLGLPQETISKILGVSRTTIYRRMRECDLSVTSLYSSCTDEELDSLVSEIKSTMPNIGYRVVRGALLAKGHRVQWDRICASMHRVDGLGVLSRMSQLGCVARRTYSVPYPKYLVHIDTNHKLIRYSMVIFGGVDGYSRKIMYLRIADNNRSETTLRFFEEAVEEFGFPLRVRRDHGGENVGVARLMFLMRGTENASFIAGKSVHNQSLDAFRDAWDNHSMRTESNLTPNQLWETGQYQNPISNPEMQYSDSAAVEQESGGDTEEIHFGVNVPAIQRPQLTNEQLEQLMSQIDPLQESESFGVDIYLQTLTYVQTLIEERVIEGSFSAVVIFVVIMNVKAVSLSPLARG
ncbi:uncharacterized protein LOC109078767 isoform X2 [Cyprinus carpio]|uniref:Uncharacterized protein LOC109078767 isoform X2 n=1 Tax=Cyprinus carpio TaxID=7962 RepID=A0A9Q9ZYA6_CYPCA|nr:uncharacterized protein LOC109078767 isoform X2 [Cyprinus carpio]